MIKPPKYFISVDWGTSKLRIHVVDAVTLAIVESITSDQGIKNIYNKYQAQKGAEQQDFFTNFLLGELEKLSQNFSTSHVIISGMASSNIGLHEMEYAMMPFCASGKDLNHRSFVLSTEYNSTIISGVKSECGVMRGEEIQAVGLAEELKNYGSGLLLLPGTHSKHLTYKDGNFLDLQTYMTGEVFDLLSKSSILEDNVKLDKWSSKYVKSFQDGVRLGSSGELTRSLFSIRVKYLLNQSSKEENYYFLSGLIIGDELSYLNDYSEAIFLATSGLIKELYKLALETISTNIHVVIFDEETIQKSILIGHRKILMLYGN